MTLQAGSAACCLQAEQHCPDRGGEDAGWVAYHRSRAANWVEAILAAAAPGAPCPWSADLGGAPALHRRSPLYLCCNDLRRTHRDSQQPRLRSNMGAPTTGSGHVPAAPPKQGPAAQSVRDCRRLARSAGWSSRGPHGPLQRAGQAPQGPAVHFADHCASVSGMSVRPGSCQHAGNASSAVQQGSALPMIARFTQS